MKELTFDKYTKPFEIILTSTGVVIFLCGQFCYNNFKLLPEYLG